MSDAGADAISDIELRLDAVDTALERLRQGTYRTCEVCGEEITDDLLAADPVRTTCAAHPRLTD